MTAASTRWDARYATMRGPPGPPCALLLEEAERLPRQGRALDVAGGRGRHALWLAARGLDTTLLDGSAVGLGLATAEAARRGLPLHILRHDLEAHPTLPAGPWDLIVWTFYLNRIALPSVSEVLAPGGLLLLAHPTVRNLERHPRPSARFLLDEGELPPLLPGLDLLRHDEGWTADGHHEAWVLARRPA
jgi:tellurite methyltransferase